MSCRQCQGIEKLFNQKRAPKELKKYRKKGPDFQKTTRMLIDALKAEGIEGMTLLDIGGGIGAIQHELLNVGVSSAIDVEASSAYVEAAKEEAERQGHANRMSHYHGNFVDLAPDIPQADIVTLDRVICCYHDMQPLVRLSSEHARRLYGVAYPRDAGVMGRLNKVFFGILNFGLWIVRNPFRVFVHPTDAVDAVVRENGFEQRSNVKTGRWQIVVYARQNGRVSKKRA